MKIRFTHPAWRWLFLIGVLGIATVWIFQAGRRWRAGRWAQSAKPENWLRAAHIEPDNAEHWFRLGRYHQLDFTHMDLPLAISYYRRAVGLDSHSAGYWMDLAETYEMQGDADLTLQAFNTAQSLYPISAEVAWRYGNFLLRQGRLPEAFAQVRRALRQNPKLATLAISRCWRASHEIEPILLHALPADSEVYLTAVDYLVAEHQADAALAVWQRLVALRASLELRRVFPLIEELNLQDRTERAWQVWKQALGAVGVVEPGGPANSLVWDGGFEGPVINGGFGWRHQEAAGAAFELDTEMRHSGARSLRITFDGSANLDFSQLMQFVPVEPRSRYRFAAYLRTGEISTDSGVRFWIYDPRHTTELSVFTPNLVGTQPWALDEVDFSTGPQTHVVAIVLRRVPSQKFDNKIRGTVWVDDVSLTRISEEAARPRP